MTYYNARFIKNGEPQGAEYLFKCELDLNVGDVALHRTKKKVVITSVAEDDLVDMVRERVGENNIGLIEKVKKDAK